MAGATFLFACLITLLFVCIHLWLYVKLSCKCLSSENKSNSLCNESNNAFQRIDVIIPDMFQTFLRIPPTVNPHYEAVKLESEKWLSGFCSYGKMTEYAVHRCDFSYFVSISAPFASPAELRTLCDWGNWVFPYDDMFDNGHLKDRPDQARQVMYSLMAAMDEKGHVQPKLKIVEAHDTVVKRIGEKAPLGVQTRFAEAMRSYSAGTLRHVEDASSKHMPSLEDIILVRRESAGVKPLYHLVEYAHNLDIPDEVFNDPHIQELEILGMDMVSISNDILSYLKEETEGVPHNMVSLCRMNGMMAQEAFDTVGELLQERYQNWDVVEGQVRSWGEEVDTHVRKYIEAIKCVVKANLYWSFESERYLGRDAAEIRRTRKIRVLASPAFLSKTKR
ncbi:isoprenoid synthase domain-containing protein [Diaporthe sp. PMI_573]|nr:isoprenoid synthase domain-containing protein [Diaporthaceae sp. PMI_573]